MYSRVKAVFLGWNILLLLFNAIISNQMSTAISYIFHSMRLNIYINPVFRKQFQYFQYILKASKQVIKAYEFYLRTMVVYNFSLTVLKALLSGENIIEVDS